MKQYIVISLVFCVFVACSEKEPAPKKNLSETNTTKKVKIVKKKKETTVILKEFIPEHLRNAKIEVVKHY